MKLLQTALSVSLQGITSYMLRSLKLPDLTIDDLVEVSLAEIFFIEMLPFELFIVGVVFCPVSSEN